MSQKSQSSNKSTTEAFAKNNTWTTNCLNCRQQLDGEFCGHCGQKKFDPEISFARWVSEQTSSLLRLDSKYGQTVVDLLINPGAMVLGYVGGHRVPYVPPIRFALINGAFWIFLIAMMTVGNDDVFTQFFLRFGQLATLLMVPILAGLTYLVFKPSNARYRDEFTLMMYWIGQCFLFRIVLIVASWFVELDPDWWSLIDLALIMLYLGWSLWRFHLEKVSWLPVRVLVSLLLIHGLSKGLFMLAGLLVMLANSG